MSALSKRVRLAKAEKDKQEEQDEEALRRTEKELDGLLFAAFSAQEEKKYEEGIDFYSKALSIMQSNRRWRIREQLHDLHYNKAVCCSKVGNIKDAIEDLSSCIALQPTRPPALLLRGIQLERQDKREEALADFEKAIALAEDELDYYCIRAAHYVKIGIYHKAISDCDHILKRNPRHQFALIIRGDTKKMSRRNILGSHDEEVFMEDYSEALKVDMAAAKKFIGRGFSFHRFDEYMEIVEHYIKTMTIRPRRTAEYRRLASVMSKLQPQKPPRQQAAPPNLKKTRGASFMMKKKVEFTGHNRSGSGTHQDDEEEGERAVGGSGGEDSTKGRFLSVDRGKQGRARAHTIHGGGSGSGTRRPSTSSAAGSTSSGALGDNVSMGGGDMMMDDDDELDNQVRMEERRAVDRRGSNGSGSSRVGRLFTMSYTPDSDEGEVESKGSTGTSHSKKQSLYLTPTKGRRGVENRSKSARQLTHQSLSGRDITDSAHSSRGSGSIPPGADAMLLKALGVSKKEVQQIRRGKSSMSMSALARTAQELFDLEVHAKDWKELSGMMATTFGCDAPARTMYNANDYAYLIAQNISPQTVAWRCALRSPLKQRPKEESPKRKKKAPVADKTSDGEGSDPNSSHPSSIRERPGSGRKSPANLVPKVLVDLLDGGGDKKRRQAVPSSPSQPDPSDVESDEEEDGSKNTPRRKREGRNDGEKKEGGEHESDEEGEGAEEATDPIQDQAALLLAARKKQMQQEEEEAARKKAEEEEEARRKEEEERAKEEVEDAPELGIGSNPLPTSDNDSDNDSGDGEHRAESTMSHHTAESVDSEAVREKEAEEEVTHVQELAKANPDATAAALMWALTPGDTDVVDWGTVKTTANKRSPSKKVESNLSRRSSGTSGDRTSPSKQESSGAAMEKSKKSVVMSDTSSASVSHAGGEGGGPNRQRSGSFRGRGGAVANMRARRGTLVRNDSDLRRKSVAVRVNGGRAGGDADMEKAGKATASSPTHPRRARAMTSPVGVLSEELTSAGSSRNSSPATSRPGSRMESKHSVHTEAAQRGKNQGGGGRARPSSAVRRPLYETDSGSGSGYSDSEVEVVDKHDRFFTKRPSAPARDGKNRNVSLRKKWMAFPSEKEQREKSRREGQVKEDRKRMLKERAEKRDMLRSSKWWEKPAVKPEKKSPGNVHAARKLRVSGLFCPSKPPPINSPRSPRQHGEPTADAPMFEQAGTAASARVSTRSQRDGVDGSMRDHLHGGEGGGGRGGKSGLFTSRDLGKAVAPAEGWERAIGARRGHRHNATSSFADDSERGSHVQRYLDDDRLSPTSSHKGGGGDSRRMVTIHEPEDAPSSRENSPPREHHPSSLSNTARFARRASSVFMNLEKKLRRGSVSTRARLESLQSEQELAETVKRRVKKRRPPSYTFKGDHHFAHEKSKGATLLTPRAKSIVVVSKAPQSSGVPFALSLR